jgi:hypothetical protein
MDDELDPEELEYDDDHRVEGGNGVAGHDHALAERSGLFCITV